MADLDTYSVLTEKGEGLFKDKGSKFYAFALPISSEDELKPLLEEIKSIHPKARHYCFAYRIGEKGEIYRANDDGEPGGSAGKPILNVLLSNQLTNTLVVVVRYFGGTLLGVSGLIHAYKEASKLALETATIEEKTSNDTFEIAFGFEQMNEVMRILKEYHVKIIEQIFHEKWGLIFEIRQSQSSLLIQKLTDIYGVSLCSNE
ncbi:MAG: IMPACT family protein [Spirosomataceae bacterium]